MEVGERQWHGKLEDLKIARAGCNPGHGGGGTGCRRGSLAGARPHRACKPLQELRRATEELEPVERQDQTCLFLKIAPATVWRMD